MDYRSPADWVDRRADSDPDAPALAFADGVVTYWQLADQVRRRVGSLEAVRSSDGRAGGELTEVPVRLDLPSIVELLAHQVVGLVPHPSMDGHLTARGSIPDAIVAVSTSGTSGMRRLVPLTMGNVVSSVEASRVRLGTGADDRWLLCLPIDHIGGLSVLFRTFEAGGAAVVGAFGPDLVDLIGRTRPTVASVVPTMLLRLLDWDPEAVAGIGTVLVGGGRLPPRLADRARSEGVSVVTTYGSSETSSQVATMRPGELLRHPGYVGAPLDGFEVTIEDPDDVGVGIVTVDGPAVFRGYMGEPPRTGPHRSSDVGRLDTDGTLTIVGRVDDIVVSGGENVSLLEIEDVVAALSGVDDVSVVGIDDDEWGTAVCAAVVTALDDGAVRDLIGSALEGIRRPRRMRVVDTIPTLANGKHDRVAVQRLFGDPGWTAR